MIISYHIIVFTLISGLLHLTDSYENAIKVNTNYLLYTESEDVRLRKSSCCESMSSPIDVVSH